MDNGGVGTDRCGPHVSRDCGDSTPWVRGLGAAKHQSEAIVPLTGSLAGTIIRGFAGGVPERSKGSDCKSDGSAFEGSNPSPTTRIDAQ